MLLRPKPTRQRFEIEAPARQHAPQAMEALMMAETAVEGEAEESKEVK
jgi:hypothetical protein